MKKEELEKLEKLNGFEKRKESKKELLKEDIDLSEESQGLFSDFLDAIEVGGKERLMEEMEKWEDEYALENLGGTPDQEVNVEDMPRAALEALFVPNPAYEASIGAAMRGNGFQLNAPQNGFEWNQNPYPFDIKRKEDLFFEIENNQSKVLLEGELEETQNEIAFDFDQRLPGRYYLRIFNEDHFEIISFFVRKDLMGNDS